MPEVFSSSLADVLTDAPGMLSTVRLPLHVTSFCGQAKKKHTPGCKPHAVIALYSGNAPARLQPYMCPGGASSTLQCISMNPVVPGHASERASPAMC